MATLKKIEKKLKKGSVMSAHAECAKRTFKVLALLTKTVIYFSFGYHYSNATFFPIFININFYVRIHTADTFSV